MITLVTGTPGSSKTLNAINEILTNEAYKDRPVYYYNIQDVTLPWHSLTEDEAKSWFELPKSSVILLDECQRVFRPMKYGDKVPLHIEHLETHRHYGHDLFLITQHPKLIDTKVRRLVGRHLHFKRQFGFEWATRTEFQKCADDPDDYFAKQEAITKRVKFPKKLYGVYKSSDEHTHKAKVPFKLYGVGIAILVTLFLVYRAVTGFGSPATPESSELSSAPAPGGVLNTTSSPSRKSASVDYFEARQPRIASVPWSAPVYDGLTEVKAFPRPQCILREKTGSCSCFSQQATPLDIPYKQCRTIVAAGYFDPTRPDRSRSTEGASGASVAPADTGATSSPHQRILNALEIKKEIAEMAY